jgi:serine/threonine-protein kinase
MASVRLLATGGLLAATVNIIAYGTIGALSGCGSGAIGSPETLGTQASALAAPTEISDLPDATAPAQSKVPAKTVGKTEWRKAMLEIPTPSVGCFKAEYPNPGWEEVACAKGSPATPFAQPKADSEGFTIGNGTDNFVQVSSNISSATGYFPHALNLFFGSENETGQNGSGKNNNYSLQLNTNNFPSPLCNGHPGCSAWEQFVYSSSDEGQSTTTGEVVIEMFLFQFGTCPSGWEDAGSTNGTTDCTTFSSGTSNTITTNSTGGTPVEASAAVELLLPVASALCAAHDAGVIHRDVKPSNIVLARERAGAVRPVVVDFGISKDASVGTEEDVSTCSEAILGTMSYLAPEVVRDASAASPASDQYALGVVLYECVTGRRPFSATNPCELLHAILTTSPLRPSAVNPRLPEGFDAMVVRAIAKERSERYAAVQEMASALLSFATRRGWAAWGPEFASVRDFTGSDPTESEGHLDGVTTFARSRSSRRRLRWTTLTSIAVAAGALLGGAASSVLLHRTETPRVGGACADTSPATDIPAPSERALPLLPVALVPLTRGGQNEASDVAGMPSRDAPRLHQAMAMTSAIAPSPARAPSVPSSVPDMPGDTVLGSNLAPILR